ncbi:DUF3073 domain-containing protein [Auritidibacter ignavus]|uniref:DUF3073 domain-containing protein n=1 Tax=Auritidibacter ignavus TaxID=678932 RepID=UPI00109C54D8|nr:DUF3073 domain-containing protein [Auritidibacter ignavus]
MGRGRQKAKAARQARDIKYFSPATDLAALERELSGKKHDEPTVSDEYADYADKYNVDEDEDDHDEDDYGYSSPR